MALINCRECGSQVSTQAVACPKCGAKAQKKSGCGTALLVLLLLPFGLIFGCVMIGAISGSSSPSTPSTPKEIVENSSWDGSVRQVERYLKASLKDPDSYQSIEWGQVAKTPGGGFMVRHKYRAKNSFGGYVVEERIFVLDAQGGMIESVAK